MFRQFPGNGITPGQCGQRRKQVKFLHHMLKFPVLGIHPMPRALQQPSYNIVVHEITRQHFEIGAHRFDFISLPPAGNHGLRFTWNKQRYAITGDSHFHDAEIDFLRDVDLAIIDSGHLEDTEIVQLAVSSRAKTIVCSHLYREINAQHLQSLAANADYEGTILVGRDLLSFVL